MLFCVLSLYIQTISEPIDTLNRYIKNNRLDKMAGGQIVRYTLLLACYVYAYVLMDSIVAKGDG